MWRKKEGEVLGVRLPVECACLVARRRVWRRKPHVADRVQGVEHAPVVLHHEGGGQMAAGEALGARLPRQVCDRLRSDAQRDGARAETVSLMQRGPQAAGEVDFDGSASAGTSAAPPSSVASAPVVPTVSATPRSYQ